MERLPNQGTSIATRRIYELDFLRGFCILLMVMDHTFFDLAYYFYPQWFPGGEGSGFLYGAVTLIRTGYFPWILRDVIWALAVFNFVFISGISCSFSHSNLKRGLRLAAVAIGFTIVTYGVDLMMGHDDEYTIRFGILHLLATSILVFSLLKPIGRGPLIALALLAIGIGLKYAMVPLETDIQLVGVLFHSTSGFRSADYFPVFPWIGYFLLGAAIGPLLYPKKSSRLPRFGPRPWMEPVMFIGRHSLIVYVIHQPIIYGILSVLTRLAG